MIFNSLIFLICCLLLSFSSDWLIKSLTRIAKFLSWREFVVAFFVMAIAGSIPNLFLGISSAVQRVPQLSLGDVIGGNVVDLTLAVSLAVFFSKRKEIPAMSRTVQKTCLFTLFVSILPLILILDKSISRVDGFLLILCFLFYLGWLFSKQERFKKPYDGKTENQIFEKLTTFLKDLGRVFLGIFLLLIVSRELVKRAIFLADIFSFPLIFIGILITGIGNSLPEISFAIASAKRGDNWMILGDLMGAVIVPSTLVLGITALIYPIFLPDISPFTIARTFLFFSAIFFFIFARTDRKITQKEAMFLFLLYLVFFLFEIFTK